jgi:hypothetical protein
MGLVENNRRKTGVVCADLSNALDTNGKITLTPCYFPTKESRSMRIRIVIETILELYRTHAILDLNIGVMNNIPDEKIQLN